jgi:branched-chain amino acid transport system substrate-binding protein
MRWLWLAVFLWLPLPIHAADVAAVRLGLVVPTAGEAGPVAQRMRRAADLAVADWGPTLGRRIELRVEEDAFDPRHAVVGAQRLVQEGVWGVVGHYYSSSSIAAAVVYHEAGIPQVTATSTHPRLTTQGFETVFRVCGRDDQQGQTAADFFLTRLKVRRVGVVHDRTEYGRGLVDAFRREWTRRAAPRIAADESLAQGDRDFATQVMRLKEARVEAIFFGGVFREAGHLLRQVRQAGMGAVFAGGDAVRDPAFVALAGEEAAAGAYVTSAPDAGLLESARPLRQRYEALYGSIGSHVVEAYDAVSVLLRAIHVAKIVDPGGAALRHIARTIRATPYHGARGTLRWDKHGDLTSAPYAVYVTRRGGRILGWFDQVPSQGPVPRAE